MDATNYISFTLIESSLKTEIWIVTSNRHGNELGRIKWYGAWHQYAFYPAYGTIWNPDCLKLVNEKINGLMSERGK